MLSVPAPDTVTVSHSPISIGSTVTLTCTMVLSPLVDVAVTVNTVWTGPDGFMTTNTAQPVMGSTTTYTSTAMVSSFGREKSGVYVCGANIDSAISPFLVRSIQMNGTVRVTLGKLRNLIMHFANIYNIITQASISLEWGQSILTTVSFQSLRLGRLIQQDSSASLTGCHVVGLHQTELESGTFLIGLQLFQLKAVLHHSIEPEEMMVQSL